MVLRLGSILVTHSDIMFQYICFVVLGGSWWFYEKMSWDQKCSQFHKPPRKELPISLIQWWRRVSELHSSIFGRCMEINHPILQCQELKSLCGEICILHTLYIRVSVMICGHIYMYVCNVCMCILYPSSIRCLSRMDSLPNRRCKMTAGARRR